MKPIFKFKDLLFFGSDEEKKNDYNDSKESKKSKKSQNPPNCPGKHGLTLFNTMHPNFGCDFCSKSMLKNAPMHGCRKCDYDLCIDCYKQVDVFMQQNDTKKGVEFKINKKNGAVTFYPCPNIDRAKQKFKTTPLVGSNYCYNINNLEAVFDWKKKISVNPEKRNSSICSFIDCAELAYAKHYPIVLKPEHIFILVLQAVSTHVDQNAEKLRHKYVSHEGKKTLTVKNFFVRGSKSNDWGREIGKFAAQIDKNTKSDTVPLFESNFSTSTLVEQIACKVCLMSTCKNYFKYSMMSFGCGFPEITLEGNIDDWILLKKKCTVLLNKKVDKKFGSRWGKALLPLLDRFIGAFKGDIDMVFWNSMVYKGQWRSVERTGLYGSGGDKVVFKQYISGWINVLFPFLGDENVWNHWCVPYDPNLGHFQYKGGFDKKGPEPNQFPKGRVNAPVQWTIVPEGKTYPLSFEAGYMGFEQNKKSLALTPIIGWYIKHKEN